MLKVEVIVAAVNKNCDELIKEMNIHSDVIIANQTDHYEYEEYTKDDHKIRMVSTKTRGVGLNRNIGLQLSQGDILLLADDDNIYFDDYPEIVEKAFIEKPDADVIIFQLQYIKDGKVIEKDNFKTKRKHMRNGLGYGGSRIAVRRKAVLKANLSFTNLFGGGCRYSCGEDSQFLVDCYRSGLHVYTYNATIGNNIKDTSTWFKGYDEKYFYDIGAFIASAFPKFLRLPLLFYYTIHLRKQGDLRLKNKHKLIYKGICGYKSLMTYEDYSNTNT